jgi:hypothetical protein
MDFVLIDESGAAATTSGQTMDPATLAQIAAACERQLNVDVGAHWGGAYRVRAGTDGSDVQPGECVFALLATLPDAPGAIAYHDVNGVGVPVLYDAVTLSDTLTGAGNSVSVAISHELCETAGDEAINAWRDAGGTEYAQELCDAVEAQSYFGPGFPSVAVSNFVTQAFFTPNHAGPFDFMSSVGTNPAAPVGPFMTAPGGYQIVRGSGTNEGTVSARIAMHGPGGMRRPFRHDSRRAKRGIAA